MTRHNIVPGVAFIVELSTLRETPSVHFHELPVELVKEVAAIDRVEHGVGAFSPISREHPEMRPWYMHTHQEDNLIVLCGQRNVDLYAPGHGSVESFEVTPHFIRHNGAVVSEGPALLGWGVGVFHRIVSPGGSISMNFARHFDGFNLDTNFNIYDLDVRTGAYTVLRVGKADQPEQYVGE
ncbi:hypothetical protein KGO06_01140 [Patescibacteria group bacterium]|nr:hypothetical protein [Patescibacteria group bacterium]